MRQWTLERLTHNLAQEMGFENVSKQTLIDNGYQLRGKIYTKEYIQGYTVGYDKHKITDNYRLLGIMRNLSDDLFKKER